MSRRLVPTTAAFGLAMVLVLPACDSGDGVRRVSAKGATNAGQASFTFAGTVAGPALGQADVECWEPAEDGDRYRVHIDTAEGFPVGATRFKALDLAVAGYEKPGTYDLGRSLADDDVERDDFFLLFDHDPNPFGLRPDVLGPGHLPRSGTTL